ncbi:MAG: alpha-1,4-glucan--maltose-1-phosphate maltosyltransferase [Chloroflexi bacterium]|nr:alpha-1,4-glucan--maltose-1-phosphate maltosyltransferase [Chloroflexota bacterium]
MLAKQQRVIIQNVYPEVDCGHFAAKREQGELCEVWADVFQEGHGALAAVLKYRRWDEAAWHEAPLRYEDNDRWRGEFSLAQNSRYLFTIQAWPDVFASWRQDVGKKAAAGQDVVGDLLEGAALLREGAGRAAGEDAERLRELAGLLAGNGSAERRLRVALGDELAALMAAYPDRSRATDYDRELEVYADRERARFAAWYELFPRSQGRVLGGSGTFADAAARLPEIAALGFDVVYLPPIHPIGRTNRKGPENSLVAGPHDPGSPYAIGAAEGGHTAVHPELGTLADFQRFLDAARELGMEVALDFAIQVAPDHPWAREHPEWFYRRADGSIKYAENPPKKYEDIYPLNFDSPAAADLWQEMKRVLRFWIEQGVRIFRVDNPHTKPLPFWQWLIREIQDEHPDVIFLAEAFTRPKLLEALAKVGFSQSYTYFTWRNFKDELTEYFTYLTQSTVKEYLRGNLFTNTPDILPRLLQEGGRPAFKIRAALAATLSSLYGIYSGFELCENRGIPGKEEYLHSEKYEYKVWDWDRPGNIKDYLARLNAIRRANPALQYYKNLRFYRAGDENVLFYGKAAPDRGNAVLVAVNLDPFQAHETTLRVPIRQFGIEPEQQYIVHELISDTKQLWKGAEQTLRLDPAAEPAAIFAIRGWQFKDYEDPCY